jgi:ribonucleoside-diphosphate reductase alpha chain
LEEKVRLAAVIGTIQGLATTFPGMRPEWKANCEDERLLGVDITGQQDCPAVQDAEVLSHLKGVAISTNQRFADVLGINHSAAVTCNKPSGNSSTLLNCSSGIHARWSSYYVRNVRVSPHTPIYHVLRESGVPMDPENGQTEQNATSWVVHFPVQSPEGAVTRKGRSAIQQCEYWLLNKLNWTEHNPSVTITYQPEELIDLMNWVWEHRDLIGGMAFLPADDAQYAQMPYEEISEEKYKALMAVFPGIDFSLLCAYEKKDETEASQTVACMSGSCDI